jgi:DnaJ family protein A protein 2
MVQQMQSACGGCKGQGKVMSEKDKCQACKGNKVYKDRKVLEVNIEKGMVHGQKIKFSGEADEVPGTLPGDVIIVIQEKEHEQFKRKGADLVLNFDLQLSEALCGCTKTITHLDGRVLKIESPAGQVIKHDSVKLVKGEGMPQHGNIFNKGGLFVHFSVKFPKTLPLHTINAIKAVLPVPDAPMLSGEEEDCTMTEVDMSQFGKGAGGGRSATDEDEDEGGQGGQKVQCGQN